MTVFNVEKAEKLIINLLFGHSENRTYVHDVRNYVRDHGCTETEFRMAVDSLVEKGMLEKDGVKLKLVSFYEHLVSIEVVVKKTNGTEVREVLDVHEAYMPFIDGAISAGRNPVRALNYLLGVGANHMGDKQHQIGRENNLGN